MHDVIYLSDMSAHSMVTCSKLRVSASYNTNLEISVYTQAPHAQRPPATRHLCRCLWFQTLTFAQRPFQHGEVRSVRLSNKGVPMFCPFAQAQERNCGGMFVSIFGKYSTGEPRSMLTPCPCGPSVTTPSSCAGEGGGATIATPTSPPDPHGTTDSGTSANRKITVRARLLLLSFHTVRAHSVDCWSE